MKLIVSLFFLTAVAQGFSQESINRTGSLCNDNLVLNVVLLPGTSVLSWEKDGLVLEGELSSTINGAEYGPGVYEVILAEGDETKILSLTIEAEEALSPDFIATNYPAAAVTFFADQSTAETEVIAWNWDFGNGETSTLQHPRIMFTEEKDYSISLTVTTSTGCSQTITKIHHWSFN